jgi:pimeloyl-ACP methyl ester carboxylesterase
MTDADWRRMAKTSSDKTHKGYRLAYDPGIAQNFRRFWLPIHANLWRYWDRISCPVLILRGAESDFLTPLLLERMLRRLPHADVIEFEGVGHTPTLNATAQIDPVAGWLDAEGLS